MHSITCLKVLLSYFLCNGLKIYSNVAWSRLALGLRLRTVAKVTFICEPGEEVPTSVELVKSVVAQFNTTKSLGKLRFGCCMKTLMMVVSLQVE